MDIYIYGYQLPDLPGRARYQIVPGTRYQIVPGTRYQIVCVCDKGTIVNNTYEIGKS